MNVRLNLGAGSTPEPDWHNVDMIQLPGIDTVHDLNVTPWPWPDASAVEVKAIDVFEHVDNALDFMSECWRVMKGGAELYIHTSYHGEVGSFTDPTHKRFCTLNTFDYWVPGTYLNQRYGAAYARGCHFEKVSISLDGDPGYLNVMLRKLG